MRSTMTILGITIVTSIATAQGQVVTQSPMLKKARLQFAQASEWVKVNIANYNCSIQTVETNNSKCAV